MAYRVLLLLKVLGAEQTQRAARDRTILARAFSVETRARVPHP